MRLRYHVTEFSQIIHKEFGEDSDDVTMDFLRSWLHADPEIFLYENRRELGSSERYGWRYNPDMFHKAAFTGNTVIGPLGKPMFMEIPVNRSHLIGTLGDGGSPNNYFKHLEANFNSDSKYFDLVENIKRQDIEPTQWTTFLQVSVCMSLVLRFCKKYRKNKHPQIPEQILIDYANQHRDPPKPGPKGSDDLVSKKEDYEHLVWLLETGIHSIRKGGVQDAAIQIKEIWDVERGINSIDTNIRRKYNEELSKSK